MESLRAFRASQSTCQSYCWFYIHNSIIQAHVECFLIPYFSVRAIIQFVVNICEQSRLKGQNVGRISAPRGTFFPVLLCVCQQRVLISVEQMCASTSREFGNPEGKHRIAKRCWFTTKKNKQTWLHWSAVDHILFLTIYQILLQISLLLDPLSFPLWVDHSSISPVGESKIVDTFLLTLKMLRCLLLTGAVF